MVYKVTVDRPKVHFHDPAAVTMKRTTDLSTAKAMVMDGLMLEMPKTVEIRKFKVSDAELVFFGFAGDEDYRVVHLINETIDPDDWEEAWNDLVGWNPQG